ncbi:hypothetical protein SSS_03751 [Sarcoptes scabiei]|uniref:EGF-like domain-containing protein n=1 Tax=Sarcoptes scabiei TaxID=52283 RepID=A0A834VH79_SARSC|nr:hypothetical protein SSS_03751 [Sarcoptes scabiei]
MLRYSNPMLVPFFWIIFVANQQKSFSQDFYPRSNVIYPLKKCYLDFDCLNIYSNSKCAPLDQYNRQGVCQCTERFVWNGQQCTIMGPMDPNENDCWNRWNVGCSSLWLMLIAILVGVVLTVLFVISICLIVSCNKS